MYIILLLSYFFSSESHNVVGTIRLNHEFGHVPSRSDISFNAYMKKDPSSILNQSSNGSFYDPNTGIYGFNIGNFSQNWQIGDSIIISVTYKDTSQAFTWKINGEDLINTIIFNNPEKKDYKILVNNKLNFQNDFNFSILRTTELISVKENSDFKIMGKQIIIYLNKLLNRININERLKLEFNYQFQDYSYEFTLDTLQEFELKSPGVFQNNEKPVHIDKPYFSTIPGKINNELKLQFNFNERAEISFFNIQGKKILKLNKENSENSKSIFLNQFNLSRPTLLLMVVSINGNPVYKNTIGVIQ